MKDFIEYIARQLVDKSDEVGVTEKKIDEETTELILKVSKNDIGKVIGKRKYRQCNPYSFSSNRRKNTSKNKLENI